MTVVQDGGVVSGENGDAGDGCENDDDGKGSGDNGEVSGDMMTIALGQRLVQDTNGEYDRYNLKRL